MTVPSKAGKLPVVPAVYSLREVACLINVSPGTLRGYIINKTVPCPIRLSPRKLVWLRETIDAFLVERQKAAGQEGDHD
jgi:predicted DNA-binding transcriptional regulator AlpA